MPAACRRHAPLPLHVPSVPQAALGVAGQWSSGSCPAGTAVHVPTLAGKAHDRQGESQADEQQTPCAQMPDAHSASREQTAPMTFGVWQEPDTQTCGGAQSASPEHESAHSVAEAQTYPRQDTSAAAWHSPLPSHVRGGVRVAAWQERDPPQIVPAA